MRKNRGRSLTRWLATALIMLVSGLVALTSLSCSALKWMPQEEGLHPRLTRFGYLEEGKLVSLLVDTEATRRREGDSVVPFGIGVANIGLRRLTLTRESFTLIDDQGQRYAMVSVREARSGTSTMSYDRRLSRAFIGAFTGRFDAWPQQRADFFPEPGGSTVTDRVELFPRSWTVDILYFPHPEGDLVGRRYEMWLDTEELEEPVFVKFAVK
ncbi:MAG: hypothetical protein JSV80_05265 [Acidobacteriota bacterium]|nr:MAG: hypothetical protein JSV80_05265 [Acidobacteriota bacterium]